MSVINVNVRSRNGEMEIYAVGHANFADNGQPDIVCASASTILQLAVMGLQQLASQYPEHVKVNIMSDSE